MSETPPAASPLIVVTGAAGRLGRQTVAHLRAHGFRVRPSDRVPPPAADSDWITCDLLEISAAGPLLRGAAAVVHLGNHPGLQHPQRTFNENVAINLNVFQAAAEEGVKRILFSSTLQVIGSHRDRRTVCNPTPRPAYPLSPDTPARPANTYALSKVVSEEMLRYYADRCGIATVALRLPFIEMPDTPFHVDLEAPGEDVLWEGFARVSPEDAASAIRHVLQSDLCGFRIYTLGQSGRCPNASAEEVRRRFFPDVPDDVASLLDDSRLRRETGWRPHSS